jgi:hypothetical protein
MQGGRKREVKKIETRDRAHIIIVRREVWGRGRGERGKVDYDVI